MSIKLKGSSDGSVSFDAPADTSPSGSDITLTLPTSAGSANQFLKNSGTAGTLEYSSMVETSTGVGIGTSAPDDTLHLDGSTGHGLKLTDNNSHTTVFRTHSDGGIVKTASNHDLLFGTDDAERMRITNAGKIQVTGTRGGSLQPSDNDSLELFTSASNGNANTGCGLTFYNNDGNGAEIGGTIQVAKENGNVNNTAGYMRFSTRANNSSPAERMRITSGGNVSIGTTTTNPGDANTNTGVSFQSNGKYFLSCAGDGGHVNRNSNGYILHARRSGNFVGGVSVSTTNTAFNTSSDYRLKENVVDITDGITRVKQLQPKRFNFIVDADTTVDGFLAHEAQTVVPEAVTGTHNEVDDDGNAVMQGIDQSKLVPLLTAALQEAIAKIETLETKVAALEAA